MKKYTLITSLIMFMPLAISPLNNQATAQQLEQRVFDKQETPKQKLLLERFTERHPVLRPMLQPIFPIENYVRQHPVLATGVTLVTAGLVYCYFGSPLGLRTPAGTIPRPPTQPLSPSTSSMTSSLTTSSSSSPLSSSSSTSSSITFHLRKILDYTTHYTPTAVTDISKSTNWHLASVHQEQFKNSLEKNWTNFRQQLQTALQGSNNNYLKKLFDIDNADRFCHAILHGNSLALDELLPSLIKLTEKANI